MQSNKDFSHGNARRLLAFAIISLFGACAVIFSAASSAQYGPTANVIRTGNAALTAAVPKTTVRGQIVYEETGRPVRRASFSLLSFNLRNGETKSGLTNENGEFVLSNVAEGSYFITVNAPGIVGVLSYLDSSAGSEEESRSQFIEQIRLTVEEIVVPAGGGEVQVLVRAKRGAAIGGRIFYTDGSPAIGVAVEVLRKTDEQFSAVISDVSTVNSQLPEGFASAKTDDRGVYRVAGLPSGEYIVRVSEPVSHTEEFVSTSRPFAFFGNQTSVLTTYHPNVNDVEKAEVIKLEIGQDAAEINIAVADYALFGAAGKVVARNTREAVKGARVSFRRDDKTFSFNNQSNQRDGSVSTDEQGNWFFRNLPAGKYKIKVEPPYNDGAEYEYDGNRKTIKTPKPKLSAVEKEIVIAEKNLSEVTIEMPFGGRVAGKVAADGNQPLPKTLTVTAVDERGETQKTSYLTDYSDAKNTRLTADFELDGLPAGKTSFAVTAEHSRTEKSANDPIYYVKSIKSGDKELLGSHIEITENANVEKVQIVLGADGGRLKGKVKLKGEDKPAVGVRIALIPVDSGKWQVTSYYIFAVTNQNGEFEAQGAPVEYFVIFLNEKDKINDINQTWIRERTNGADKITIKPNASEKVNLTAP